MSAETAVPDPIAWSIRPYRPEDLDRIHEIAARTGNAGADATDLVDESRLFGELWAAPYVTLEPEHAHVLDDGTGTAIGYAIAAVDAIAFEARCAHEWWPGARARHPIVAGGERLDDLLIALIHHRPEPDTTFAERFPSELHINLLPVAQGVGWGRRLMEAVLESLRGAGSPGVHLGTHRDNARAIAFYEHLGFERMSPPDETAHAVDFVLRLDHGGPVLP